MVLAMPTATTPLTTAGQSDQLDQAFQALADSSRRAMVVRLTRGPASVSELAEPLKMSMPSVMQHIDVLQRSGLVHSEKVGRVRTCRLEPGPMQTLEQWIAEHRAVWERSFDRLGQVLDEVFPDEQGDSSQT
jgi:DNA-binding transcriptional ArsR family regulator